MKINPGYREFIFNEPKRLYDDEYLEYRADWARFPNADIRSIVPMHLDFEITTHCNLKCPFCPLQKMKVMPQHMELHLLSRVLDECVPLGTMACKLNWRGEPTVNPELPKFMETAKRKGIKELMINTNGLILNDRLLNAYTNYLDKLIVSVDSIKPDVYRKLRVGGELDKVLKNIQQVLDYRKQHGKWRPVIRVQKIELAETADEPFEEFWRDFGVDQAAINSYKEKSISEPTPVIPLEGDRERGCAQLWQRLVIAADGSVYPCCEGYRLGSLGNAKFDSIEEIWNSEKMNHWRDVHWRGKLMQLECKNCSVTLGKSYYER